MENELVPQNNQLSPQQPANVETSRAVQEVQAALVMAKRFPRDLNQVYANVMTICKRKRVAEQAQYQYPKAGAIVKGPSIRLTEAIAQNFGNLDFGVKELERNEGYSVAESYCWDLERNTRSSKRFEVPHKIGLKGGKTKVLTDQRDIYEHVANYGARRMRACILGILPVDLIEDAIEMCTRTLSDNNGQTKEERIQKLTLAFKDIGVSVYMLEEKLDHKLDLITGDEYVDLLAIYNSIRDKQANRKDFFNFKGVNDEPEGKAKELSDALKERDNG